MGDHLASAARQLGRAIPRAVPPPLPQAGAHVWEWFAELADRRTLGPLGPNPLTYADVGAWASLTGRQPRPWEVRLLMAVDRCWLQAVRPPDEKGPPARD